MSSLKCLVALTAVSLGLAAPTFAQQRVIELQVLVPPTAQTGTQQQWMRMLADVGADRVSSSVRKIDRPSVEEQQFGGSTIVTVVGVLNNNRLLLPGKSFTRSDTAKLKRYLQQLRDDGADLAMADKKAFGLTTDQLRDLHQRLSFKVAESTAKKSVPQAIDQISAAARLPLQINADAQARLAGRKPRNGSQTKASSDEPTSTTNELKGLSAGTALATLLHQVDLVLVPSRPQGSTIQLQVLSPTDAKEFWPVGWPLKNVPVIEAPRLFQREDIRIERFQLNKALPAISSRCDVPFLYDWRGIARANVDLAATEVSFNRKRTSYRVTLSKLLRQTDPPLTGELRMDENGTPFFWIEVRQ